MYKIARHKKKSAQPKQTLDKVSFEISVDFRLIVYSYSTVTSPSIASSIPVV